MVPAMILALTFGQVMTFRFLFGVFALLMLPLASFYLSPKLRSEFGLRRVIICLILMLVVIPAALALAVPGLIESPYVRFTHQNQPYYSDLARACDLLIRSQRPGANWTVIRVHGSPGSPEIHIVPVSDVSVPKIIRRLNPSNIMVLKKSVWIIVGIRQYSILWAPEAGAANSWTLSASGEGNMKVVYTETNR